MAPLGAFAPFGTRWYNPSIEKVALLFTLLGLGGETSAKSRRAVVMMAGRLGRGLEPKSRAATAGSEVEVASEAECGIVDF